MEQRIQYAKTTDGVSIAFAAVGEGPPLVLVPAWPFGHLEAEWLVPTYRLFHERMAEKTRLVRFDLRGTGLSQRNVDDLSLDARVLDLETVVDHLELQALAVSGFGSSGPIAIAYAARHPERVTHLFLWDAIARMADYASVPQLQGLLAMANADWETFTETSASVFFGWSEGEPAREFAAFLRECVTPEQFRTISAAALSDNVDLSEALSKVQAPTLVARFRDAVFPGLEAARSLAAAIPNASLATLDGKWITSDDKVDIVVKTAFDFLGVDQGAAGEPSLVGAVHTILFTDIEGSTALTGRLGDAKTRELLREHERMVREALMAHGGSEVKTMGDGFMASFSSATKALECAIAIQRAFAEHNESAQEPILVRTGLNAGEPIAEEDDLFGTAVNEAARITAAAKGGEILVANVVRELAKGKDFLFADRGETSLRGFEDPVRLFEVRWQPDC